MTSFKKIRNQLYVALYQAVPYYPIMFSRWDINAKHNLLPTESASFFTNQLHQVLEGTHNTTVI